MKSDGQINQFKLIQGYLKGDALEFLLVSGWIEQVVKNYNWGLKEFSEDIIQEVRLKLYLNLKENKFRNSSGLKTYVYRIAKYTCIDFLRRKKFQSGSEIITDNLKTDENPLDQLMGKEKEVIMNIILKEISSMCRDILQLVFGEKLSYIEISSLLNIAEGTVKSRVSRCLKKAVELKEKYWNDLHA